MMFIQKFPTNPTFDGHRLEFGECKQPGWPKSWSWRPKSWSKKTYSFRPKAIQSWRVLDAWWSQKVVQQDVLNHEVVSMTILIITSIQRNTDFQAESRFSGWLDEKTNLVDLGFGDAAREGHPNPIPLPAFKASQKPRLARMAFSSSHPQNLDSAWKSVFA